MIGVIKLDDDDDWPIIACIVNVYSMLIDELPTWNRISETGVTILTTLNETMTDTHCYRSRTNIMMHENWKKIIVISRKFLNTQTL